MATLGFVMFAAVAASSLRAGADGEDAVVVAADAIVAAGQVPGFDISWPQCNKQYPQGPVAFAIIGLNGGRPFTANPCFLHQYRWAQLVETRPAIYINMAFPKPDAPEATTGPYGTCAEGDDWCRAYNYGYAIGRDTIERVSRFGIVPSFYWLDVEAGNYWLSDPVYNAQVIRGTVEFFRERSIPFGIYGTPYQWRIIAGNARYGVPVWTAGAQGITQAMSRCDNPAYAFAGGEVVLVQYYDYGFDTNYACPGGHPYAAFPLPDPQGREGPPGRALAAAAGPALAHWHAIPMLAGGE
ncbi:MAG: hypothetical protein IT303_09730 [Dehalococcoidia bacterium]|nr:hypothetical protein [Dehalococcoidia bacterium]